MVNKILDIMPSKVRDFYRKHEDKVLYLIFGGFTTVISFIVQKIMFLILGTDTKVAISIATFISWLVAVTFAYITNKKYVFKSKTKTKVELIYECSTFYGARVFSLVLELGIMLLFVGVLHFNEDLVKLCGQVVIVILNYILSKLIIFKKK